MRNSIVYIIFLFSFYGYTQDTVSKNLVYSELKFSSVRNDLSEVASVTINYERQLFTPFDWLTNSIKIGIGTWSPILTFASAKEDIKNTIEATATFNFITGKRNHHLEMQLGGSMLSSEVTREITSLNDPIDPSTPIVSIVSDNVIETLIIVNAGYRYQKPGGGFVFKGLVGTWGAVTIGLGYSW